MCIFNSGIVPATEQGERFLCQLMMKSCKHLPANSVFFLNIRLMFVSLSFSLS